MLYFAPLRFRDVPGLLFRAIDWRIVGTFVLGAIVGVMPIRFSPLATSLASVGGPR